MRKYIKERAKYFKNQIFNTHTLTWNRSSLHLRVIFPSPEQDEFYRLKYFPNRSFRDDATTPTR